MNAKEMYEYCINNGYGKGFNEKTGVQHFQVIENNLMPNENVRMCFIGILNLVSISKHEQNAAVVVTDKRVIYGQKLLFNRENSKSISLEKITDITRKSDPLFTVITIDAMTDKFNIAIDRASGDAAFTALSSALNNKQTAAPTNDLDQLKTLKGLLDDGILTQEEFDAKKKQILGL
jgi:hypothetical protein